MQNHKSSNIGNSRQFENQIKKIPFYLQHIKHSHPMHTHPTFGKRPQIFRTQRKAGANPGKSTPGMKLGIFFTIENSQPLARRLQYGNDSPHKGRVRNCQVLPVKFDQAAIVQDGCREQDGRRVSSLSTWGRLLLLCQRRLDWAFLVLGFDSGGFSCRWRFPPQGP